MNTKYQFEIREQRMTHTFIDLFGDGPDEVKVDVYYLVIFTAADSKSWQAGRYNTEADAKAAIETTDWEAKEKMYREKEEQANKSRLAYQAKKDSINAQRHVKRKN